MTRVAVLQSSYIPWKGYFDVIHSVDRFVFYDDVQFTSRDWRSRNRIKTPQGLQWLTIPVGNDVNRRIEDVEIPDAGGSRSTGKASSGATASPPASRSSQNFSSRSIAAPPGRTFPSSIGS
jgi:hypothetical protein